MNQRQVLLSIAHVNSGADVDADLHVSVLGADGKSCRMPLAVLKPRVDGGSSWTCDSI